MEEHTRFRDLVGFVGDAESRFEEAVKLAIELQEVSVPYYDLPYGKVRVPELAHFAHKLSWMLRIFPILKHSPYMEARLHGYINLFQSLKSEFAFALEEQAASGDNPVEITQIQKFADKLRSIMDHSRITELLELYQSSIAVGGYPDHIEQKLVFTEAEGDRLVDMLRQRVIEIDELKATMTAKVLNSATSQFARLYARSRKCLIWQSWGWLLAAVWLIVGAVWVVLNVSPQTIASHVLKEDTISLTSFLIYGLVQKVLLVSIMLSCAIWCIRMYSATRHNAEIAKHKELSLRCMERFVAAANQDEDTKNSVLLEVTRSIFSANGVGYSTTEMDNAVTPIVNTVLAAARKG